MGWRHLEYGSSPVDWCEGNFLISPNIAEFINTVSNILFLLGPPVLIFLFKDYAKIITPTIHLVWGLLIAVGLSSAYFHATLSLLGQLLDELTILWVFMVTFSNFCPKRYMPKIFKQSRNRFVITLFIFSAIATVLSIYEPAINAFALMTLAIPVFFLLYKQIKREKDPRVYRLGVRCAIILFAAITCWVNDRLFCDYWSSIQFPYLHGFWHILIFIGSYTTCVLFAYFYVADEKPEWKPQMQFYPWNNFEYGVPYVSLKGYKEQI